MSPAPRWTRVVAAHVVALSVVPSFAAAQTVSLASAMATGDCTGTSFYQSSDASGKFLAADWAADNAFAVDVNHGRRRCTLKFTVTVPVGYKLTIGGGNTLPLRAATAMLSPLRLNGSVSRLLVESAISIDGSAPAGAGATLTGGTFTSPATLSQDRPTGSPAFESACATASKTTFQVSAVVEAAAASNYVVPWPPEAYADREAAGVRMYRLFYGTASCAPAPRSVGASESVRPPG